MKSCLVVDDSRAIRMVVRAMLAELGFLPIEAEDGSIALRLCQNVLPDAVLLDWNMPVMDGIQFLRALRKLPGGERPVVVFCSTENDFAHIRQAIDEGANEYIMKPFDSGILAAKFAQLGLIPNAFDESLPNDD